MNQALVCNEGKKVEVGVWGKSLFLPHSFRLGLGLLDRVPISWVMGGWEGAVLKVWCLKRVLWGQQ